MASKAVNQDFSEVLKHLAKFSPDAIHQALLRSNVSVSEQKEITTTLGRLSLMLEEGKKDSKTKSGSKGLDKVKGDAEIFTQCILPVIKALAEKYESLNAVEELNCNIDFRYFTHQPRNVEEFKATFEYVCTAEETVGRIKLFIQYRKGVMLNRAKQLGMNLGVPYNTERRYMSLAMIIGKWPCLVLAKLSFSQILKHQKRLIEVLSNDLKLSSALGSDVSLIVGSYKLDIQATEDAIAIPKGKQHFDPDSKFLDAFKEPPSSPDEFDLFVNTFDTKSVLWLLIKR